MDFIKGDTFELAGPVVVVINGTESTDTSGWQARSQIRTAHGVLIAELDVAWLSRDPGTLRLSAPGSTEEWPVGPAKIDVQFTLPGGQIISTRAATISVVQDVTRGD